MMNPRIKEVRCIKCGRSYPVDDFLFGCPKCLKQGENASVEPIYDGIGEVAPEKTGMKRYEEFLPYSEFPSLGEGQTPVVELPRIAKQLNLSHVISKNEFQNPTGSHKDRMNPFIVARAIEEGKDTVCCASSGNEAASLAAYAAAAGIHAVMASSKSINRIWQNAITATGAELALVDTPADRLPYLQKRVDEEGWMCATNQLDVPVGSSWWGIQGYKTIAFELCEQLADRSPDYVFIPTCRGDLLYGIFAGFRDWLEEGRIDRIPKLVACEPLPRLEKVLAGEKHQAKFAGDSSLTPSIGGGTATYQSQLALEKSKGFAISVPQDQIDSAVKEMAENGLYLETSSAINLACLKKAMEQNLIPENANVVFISTSNGYKNAI